MTDKTPTGIFKRVILLLTLSWLSISSFAGACSFSDVQLSGQASYRIYENRLENLLKSDEAYIGIIKTGTVREYEDTIENIRGQEETRTFLDLKIANIETLLGEAPDFTDSDWTVAPKFSATEHLAESNYASTPRPFGFWDQLSLSSPKVPWFGTWSNCGFDVRKTLDTDTYYLAFDEPYGPMAFEPLNGLRDPLISDFKALIAGRTSAKTHMTPQKFFSNIDGYNEIVITACPSAIYEGSDGLITHATVYDVEDFTGDNTFKSLEHYKSDLSHIRLLDLLGYEDWTNVFPVDACVVGARYLVLETTYENPRVRQDWLWGETPIKHRFLKVQNGVIDLANVKSNIKISGEPIISVEKVKTWITEDRP